MRQITLFRTLSGLCITALASATVGCAYNATGAAPPRTLIFEYSVEGNDLVRSPNIAYYFVIDADKDPATTPLVNGPAPATFPYPDPRSYLPFVRDERAFLDRRPITVPNSTWQTYFALYEDGGRFVMWQARLRQEDGTVNERFRQLVEGREWGIQGGKTVQITLPLNRLLETENAVDADIPDQLQCNLAVGIRGEGTNWENFVIDKWLGTVPNQFFTVQTSPINQNLYDTVGGVTFTQNVPPGTEPRNLNITTVSYRVISDAGQ